jgi:VanZ family protein
MHLKRPAFRVGAWASVLLLALLSLLPSEHLTRTGAGGHLEHLLAYMCAMLLLATVHGERGILRCALALIAYAGVLEFLQRYSPGRTSSLRDFLYGAGGVVLGCAVVALSRRVAARARGLSSSSSS